LEDEEVGAKEETKQQRERGWGVFLLLVVVP
jgi:hypothetical protein